MAQVFNGNSIYVFDDHFGFSFEHCQVYKVVNERLMDGTFDACHDDHGGESILSKLLELWDYDVIISLFMGRCGC